MTTRKRTDTAPGKKPPSDAPTMAAGDNAGGTPTGEERHVLPVVEERAKVATREVDKGGVRVSTEVVTDDETVETELHDQTAELERVRVDRVVEERPEPRLEGDTVVVPILEERVVVTKQLVVIEEVRIKIDEVTRLDKQTIPLAKERVSINRIPPETGEDAPSAPTGSGGDAPAHPDNSN